jgi:hypothetical protein
MDSPAADRKLMLVAGAGRSGTSLFAGVMKQLDFHVPQPEVMANRTNPRGFFEPRWVVNFHARLMKARNVGLLDARPHAWVSAARAAASPTHEATLREWLAAEFADHDRLVVKDPRTSWFLPLWSATAADLGAQLSCVTMLRHPSEVLTSIRTTAGEPPNESGRAAGWVNIMLHTELQTRSFPRAYVRYDRLLADWRSELARVGDALADPSIAHPTAAAAAEIDGLIDVGLRRSPAGWDDRLTVSEPVRELADETWLALIGLAEPEPDTARRYDELDRLRDRYVRFYGDAEVIAQSSIDAARERGRRSATAATATRPAATTPARAPAPRRRGTAGLAVRLSRASRTARRLFVR